MFFLSGALDVARLAQQARRLAPKLPIGATEWAGTEQLAELGGNVVDGLLIVQNHNREDINKYTENYIRVCASEIQKRGNEGNQEKEFVFV